MCGLNVVKWLCVETFVDVYRRASGPGDNPFLACVRNLFQNSTCSSALLYGRNHVAGSWLKASEQFSV